MSLVFIASLLCHCDDMFMHVYEYTTLQEADVTEWKTKRKTPLIQKDPCKGTTQNNYKPITCLPMLWKILTAQISKEIYDSLIIRRLFPEEQKGFRKWTRDTGKLLNIEQHILNKSKTRRRNLPMAWIDNEIVIKKEYLRRTR